MNAQEFDFVERIYLNQSSVSKREIKTHINRYLLARKYLKAKYKILDASCGSGYGTEILARGLNHVIGVDISQEAIEYAKKHHNKENIEYRLADLEQPLDFPPKTFDAVISFETLEHIENRQLLLREFQRVLKNGGFLIISTPNKELTSKIGAENPYHKKELYKKEFIGSVSKFFKIRELWGQIEFIELPGWKKLLRKLIIMTDIFKLRKFIFKWMKENNIVRKGLRDQDEKSMERVNFKSSSRHFVLIAIAQKV